MTAAAQVELGILGEPHPYPEAALPDLVVAQAHRTPDAVAVRQWNQTLTYRELVGRAGALAARLRDLGVGPDQRVGVCLTRSPDLVVATLGVMMAGGAYVPLDPVSPRRRLADIATDAAPRAVVVDRSDHPLAGLGVHEVRVPGPGEAAELAAVPQCPARPDHLAHVLYTSGSTGRPKGVLTTHRNIVEFAAAFAAHTGVDASTRALGFSSPAFDAFTMDVYVPLMVGASVQLASDADRADPARLQRFIAEHRVTWGFITPAVLSLLDPGGLPEWRALAVGGDVVDPELVERWTGATDPPERLFWNMYGPTETTVLVTSGLLAGRWSEPLPIGRPLPNHRAYVVDEELRPVPPGEPGELLIGGAGLARGYLDRPELTAERFVPDPFSGHPGARLYRTGDVVYQRSDGRIGYLGRRDRQVKIRGQRIELAEIEAVLCEHPAVEQAEVHVLPGAAGPELVAFVCAPDTLTEAGIRDHSAQRLTAAMLPRHIVRLDALPVNPTTGKVDRGRLRELAASAAGRDGKAPPGIGPAPVEPGAATIEPAGPQPEARPLEREVAAIWQGVLGGPLPGAGEDFFAAGGHSIAVMRLVAAIRAELGRAIGAEDVFAGRTLAGIAERAAAAATLDGAGITTGHPPTLSPSQRRLWFIDQLAPDSAAYNVAFAERLRGRLDVAALRSALRAVAERHEVLRWRIVGDRGVPAAVCDPPADVPLPVVDLSGGGQDQVDALLAAAAATPFDLAAGPVWRATLYRLGEDDHVLGLVLHHAVADGWSQAILYRDLAAAYAGAAPAPVPAGYADYAVWRADRDRRDGDADLAWWVDHLSGAPTALDLPRDRPRPPVQTYAGELAAAGFPQALDTAVRRLASDVGATPSLVLLAAFGQVLRRLTGRTDNIVGVVVADRGESAFEDLVGFFVDIVPVRLRADDGAGFTAAVRACRDELLAVAAHPAAPLERIVDGLGLSRDPSKAPLVQVLFNVFNFAEPRLALPDVHAEPVRVAMPGSPFDLTVYLVERDGRFAIEAVYNPDLFDQVRVEALLADYLRLLGELIAAADRPAGGVAPDCPDPVWRRSGAAAAFEHTAAPDPTAPPAGPPEPAGEPRTPTEVIVAKVWCEVLGLASVGPTENFFDVGGQSLAVVAVQARLAEALGRAVKVLDLFRYPNIRALAAHLDGTAADNPQLTRAAQRGAARRNRARHRTASRTGNVAE